MKMNTIIAVAALAAFWTAPALAPALHAQEGGHEEHREARHGKVMHQGEERILQVSGSASVSVETDQVKISFAVQTEAATARESTARNAERMDAVLRALRATEAPELSLETTGFNLQPVYARPDDKGRRVVDAYRTVNMVNVTADDVEMAGALVDAAVEAGANRVASLGFVASDTEEARLEALRMAVASARREAEVMAEALGEELGPPLEVQGGADRPSPPRPLMRATTFESAQAAPTPVEAGEQTVSASVTIRYRLGR